MLRLLKRAFLALGIVIVLLCTTPLADLYSKPLVVSERPQASEVIVLMSGGIIDADWITPDGAQRTWCALRLYREGFAPFILSIGGEQADIQARMLQHAGVPAQAIIVDHATNTYRSVLAVSRIMQEHGWTSVVIVTSQFDVPRIRGVLEANEGVRTAFLAVPEFSKPKTFHLFRHYAFDITYHASYEYAAFVFYKFKGWL